MKKFLVKTCAMMILLILGIAAILFLLEMPSNSYDLAIIDKRHALAQNESPKLVLVGGSNLAFGIDSAAIENACNRDVINMGLHAGIGLGRMIDDVSPFLNSGDILLIVPEYQQFTAYWNGDNAAYSFIFDTRQFHLLSSLNYGLPTNFSRYIYQRFYSFIRSDYLLDPLSYTHDGFNVHGDYVKHLGMENRRFRPDEYITPLNQTYIKHFFNMVDKLTKDGITVALSYPSYEEQSFNNSAELIKDLDRILREKENLLVISTPDHYCFPTNYFYDTYYHLNGEGRAVRTKQLINDLQSSGIIVPDL